MAIGGPGASHIAECFWPDVRAEVVEQTAERIRASASQLSRDGTAVELTETIFVPGDEVVMYIFTGSAEAVHQVCLRAEVPFERVVESVRSAGQRREGEDR